MKRQPGEIVVFSWICWPSREIRDAAHARMTDDPRLRDNPMPFDGKRLIYGGFQMVMKR